MDTRISKNNQQKKLRKYVKRFILVVLIFIIAVIGYSFFQYEQGVKQAAPSPKLETKYEFKPPPPEAFEGTALEGTFNVLLLGIDSLNEKQASRTDSIMLGQFNTKTNAIRLVSIMRDTYVEIPDHGKHKINAAFSLGGPELLRKTIKQNFDIDVSYYALVDFKGFEKIVDTLSPSGIEIEVEKKMSKNIGVTLQPGIQKLHGKELLGYARFRHDARGDFARVERQQKVIKAVKNEFISVNGISKLPKVIGTVQPYIDTNMKTLMAIGIAKDIVLNKSDINTLVIPIKDSFTETRAENAGQVLVPDIEKNKKALNDFLIEDSAATYNGVIQKN
ncbi:LCP family protein [Peribacillus alkalitolerans]|uniref:LCP family protein n=1 Tax=Peribacillus alkalitolerans TaxID=1550385 RepID=UPI0013D06B6D|nr:LCP family protein [Peribacillus alkalitolerans]